MIKNARGSVLQKLRYASVITLVRICALDVLFFVSLKNSEQSQFQLYKMHCGGEGSSAIRGTCFAYFYNGLKLFLNGTCSILTFCSYWVETA